MADEMTKEDPGAKDHSFLKAEEAGLTLPLISP